MKHYFIAICIMLFASNVYGQSALSAKDSTRLLRLEKQIIRAELGLLKANKDLVGADSLLQIGKVMVDDGKVEDRALEVHGRTMDRNYAESRKESERLIKSKIKMK